MADADIQTTPTKLSLARLPRFPVGWIVEHPRIEGGIVKAVWFVIPFEFYLLTTFSNGFEASDFGAAAVISLIYFLVLFALSCFLALIFTRKADDFERLMRIWSITLIVTWSASLTLLALSTFVSTHLGWVNPLLRIDYDVVTHVICNKIWSCLRTPPALSKQTFVIYVTYSSVVLALLCFASRRLGSGEQTASEALGGHREPNIIAVALINAAIMMFFHAWTNSGIAIGIRGIL